MKYRQFGNTGIEVSEIGFGAWGIGGTPKDARAYGPTDDKISQQALIKAFDSGITFYDTSPLYGYGHSEKLIYFYYFEREVSLSFLKEIDGRSTGCHEENEFIYVRALKMSEAAHELTMAALIGIKLIEKKLGRVF